ncbi:MAG: hypothetical protein QOG26_1242 [Solirubrobacterales bacterium]|nr:hypothetical protein [Solirubrobacterales bacterium]
MGLRMGGDTTSVGRRASGAANGNPSPPGPLVTFVERIVSSAEQLEDLDTARWVTRFQTGEDGDAFAAIYSRYFDRIYGYLRVVFKDAHEAESGAQQVFMQVFKALPRYERRSQPFRAWLFVMARNHAAQHLRKHGRVEPEAAESINRRRESLAPEHGDEQLEGVFGWISDQDLLVLMERLPAAQRQALALRFMLGLSASEIAEALELSPGAVRMLQSRGLAFLRERLTALGRSPRIHGRARMQRWPRQARVLRARRFSLASPGATR